MTMAVKTFRNDNPDVYMKYCNTAQIYRLKAMGKNSCRILFSTVNDGHIHHKRIMVWIFCLEISGFSQLYCGFLSFLFNLVFNI